MCLLATATACGASKSGGTSEADGATPPPVPPPGDGGGPTIDGTVPVPPPPGEGGTPPPVPPPPVPPPPDGGACAELPDVPAFPGAEGFGAISRGGRCGQVIHVTTLAGSGPGSLNAALETRGPRYIVFDVSGVIEAPAHFVHPQVTIAGQTSPGGIVVRGIRINEEGLEVGGLNEDIIVRHVRSRPAGRGLDDALRLTYVRRAIFDHCSFARANDECVQISYASDITVQSSILAETLGDHSMYGGMLVNYSDPSDYELQNLAIHHNVWTRIEGRFPELSRESDGAGGTTLNLELSNNLLWDPPIGIWIKNSTEVGSDEPIYYAMNWVNNYLFAGDYRGFMMLSEILQSDRSSLYLSGNRMNVFPSWSDLDLVYCCNDLDASGPNRQRPSGELRTTRHPFPEVTYVPATDLPAWMAANAGAFPRDPMDRRLMDPIGAGTIDPTPLGSSPNDPDEPAFATPPEPLPDADRDGMPDSWELEHGLDPSTPDHNGTGVSMVVFGYLGYTNLEVYLNELADRRVAEGR